MADGLFKAPEDPDALRLVPLGGCGEFGMNLTCYLGRGKLFVVDAGVRFPDATKLGADAVLPNVDPFFGAVGGVDAYIITHGHEDHIGALPHIVPRWPAPIYATRWTAALIRSRFARHGISSEAHPVTIVDPGDKVTTKGFEFEYVHVNHSIPMACALMIRAPGVRVFHTGDFKYDPASTVEPAMRLDHLRRLGDEGIDLLIADSTNADRPGLSSGEDSVRGPLGEAIAQATGAVFVTTFASNLWRLMAIADACRAAGRRLFIAGGGLEATLGHASDLGLFALPPGLRIAEEELPGLPRNKICVVATGCQGEWRSAMARIASDEHRSVSIEAGDTVLLSARTIPGNERAVIFMLDDLRRQGATVITPREMPGLHVSGHAYEGDLEVVRQALRPRAYLPMHGTFGHMAANLEGAHARGHAGHLVESGDVVDIRPSGLSVVGRIDVELRYVDGESGVVMPPEALRERLKFGELGGAVLTGVYSAAEHRWLAPPEVSLHGLRLPASQSTSGFNAAVAASVSQRTADLVHKAGATSEEIYEELRILVRRHLAAVLKKKPVVLVKLHLL
jgi:ribonuclease J